MGSGYDQNVVKKVDNRVARKTEKTHGDRGPFHGDRYSTGEKAKKTVLLIF